VTAPSPPQSSPGGRFVVILLFFGFNHGFVVLILVRGFHHGPFALFFGACLAFLVLVMAW